MKSMIRKIALIVCVLNSTFTFAQQASDSFYTRIAGYNLSNIWHASQLKMEGADGAVAAFPEPLGFIGDNYHRFYIHYTSVIKDKNNFYQYHVTGKTRVNNNICTFTGTITVTKAFLLKKSPHIQSRQGTLIAIVDLKENPSQNESGEIKGTLITNWFIGADGQLHYDTINCVSDSFNNNQFTGTWTDYKTHRSKKCNWGDFRIPQSGDLDIGAGEFGIDKKYVMNGWQNYENQESQDKAVAQKAVTEEKRNWWK